MQYYVIILVSALRQVSGFLQVLQFPPPITDLQDLTEILLKVALNTITVTLSNTMNICFRLSKVINKSLFWGQFVSKDVGWLKDDLTILYWRWIFWKIPSQKQRTVLIYQIWPSTRSRSKIRLWVRSTSLWCLSQCNLIHVMYAGFSIRTGTRRLPGCSDKIASSNFVLQKNN